MHRPCAEACHRLGSASAQVAAIFIAFVLGLACYYAFVEAPTAVKHDMSEAYAWARNPARLQPASAILGLALRPAVEVFRIRNGVRLLSALNAGIGRGAHGTSSTICARSQRVRRLGAAVADAAVHGLRVQVQRQHHFLIDLAVDRSLLHALGASRRLR